MAKAKNKIFSNLKAQVNEIFDTKAIKDNVKDFGKRMEDIPVYNDIKKEVAPKGFVKDIDKTNIKKQANKISKDYDNKRAALSKDSMLSFSPHDLDEKYDIAKNYIERHINDIDLEIGGQITPEFKESLEKKVAQDLLLYGTAGANASTSISQEVLKDIVDKDVKILKNSIKMKRVPSMMNQYYATPVINAKKAYDRGDKNALISNLKTTGIRAGATAGVVTGTVAAGQAINDEMSTKQL